MAKIYLDKNYCCHIDNLSGNYMEIETDFFDGKCQTFIEGYRLVPVGESWTQEDGAIFIGEMIAPWKDFKELDAAQREYEREQLADMRAALELLGVSVDE